MTDTHMIRLSEATYERLRWYAFQRRLSFGKAVDALLSAADPRTPEQIAQDAHRAEVLDTQESDRP